GRAIRLELRWRAEAVVRTAGDQHLLGVGAVQMEPLRLTVRSASAADVRPFVPVQTEPAEIPEDGRLGFGGRPLDVGILDAEHELAARPARHQPVEERGARIADVQLPGWARSESQSHVIKNSELRIKKDLES